MLAPPLWLACGAVAATALAFGPLAFDAPPGILALACGVALAGGATVAASLSPGDARRGRIARGVAAAGLGAFLVALRLLAAGGDGGPGPPVSLPEGKGPWTATVEAVVARPAGQSATLALAEAALRCSARLPAFPDLLPGDSISLEGTVRPLPDNEYGRRLAGEGVAAICEATGVELERRAESWQTALETLRRRSGDALGRVLPEPEGGLAAGILVGLRERVDPGLAAAFTTAGVSHIVAISGWNIAVVAASVAALLRGLGRRRRAAATTVAIVGYTLFAGASASVVRACLMAGLALLASELGGAARASIALAWAIVVILLVEPATIGDVGFQLSAAATVGLIAWSSALDGWLGPRLPGIPRPIRESLALSLAAQAATLPIILLTFGRLAPVSPVVNLVAVPIVPPAMAAGAVALAAGWLAAAGAPGWLAGSLALPAWLLLRCLDAVVLTGASVPGASLSLAPPANVIAAALAGAIVGALALRSGRRPRERPRVATRQRKTKPRLQALRVAPPGVLAGAALLIVLGGCIVATPPPDGRVRVVVLDVGQGDAILLQGDRGGRILVDGGPDPGALLVALDAEVPAWDRRLDAVVLTHPHDDHAAGLAAAVERYRVGRVFESATARGGGPGYAAFEEAVRSAGLRAEHVAAGDAIALDDVDLRVLWPDATTPDSNGGGAGSSVTDPDASLGADANRRTNDASIVLLGEYLGRRFLLTGDAEDDVDTALVARGLPTVDVLKVAHHGSATASSEGLLAAAAPTLAVVSVGARNPYHHPSPATIARLEGHAARVLRTDREGTIEATLDAASIAVTARGPRRADLPEAGPRLLYDSRDDRSKPSGERRPPPVARSPTLAPAPLARRCRGRRLARRARRRSLRAAGAGLPPRRGRGPPA